MNQTVTSSLTSDVTITPLGAGDYPRWLPLWRGYQAFYKVAIPEVVTQETWRRLLVGDEPMFCALAWVDGAAVGLAHWILHRSTWTVGNYCYLQDLFVDNRWRGLGAGRRLIEHVYAQARATGAARVHWLTHESNTGAMLLYDRIADKPGFVQYRKLLA